MMRKLISFQRDEGQGEALSTNRWMISYADFITLLFVLFLVLYAKMPRNIEPVLPQPQKVLQPIITALRPLQKPVIAPMPPQDAESMPEKRKVLLEALSNALQNLIQSGDIALVTRPEGVLLEIKDTALFASGTAQPADQATVVLTKIATVLDQDNNLVVVEGHTDNIPIQTVQYPSNWELSSARAASVVRTLQEHGISPNRLTASGLAETKPRSSNDTVQGRSENRRVSLLVLNN
ncbi:MAG: OmpA family protein [Burkholderiaceae bacterium]